MPKDKELYLVILQKSFILVLYSVYMGFLDIFLGGLLAFSFYKGIRNGFFIELASLISLLAGIYFAIKFSFYMKDILSGFLHWNPNTIQIMAFIITFILVVIGITILAKFLTGIAEFALLGLPNKLSGGMLSVLKTILIVSIVFNIFHKINQNNWLVKQETFDSSTFYNPIQKVSQFIYPKLEHWYDDLKKKSNE